MYTRRQFGTMTIAGLAMPLAGVRLDGARPADVRLGVQTYSFRGLARTPGGDATDAVLKAMVECGVTECEFFAPQIEPVTGRGGAVGEVPTGRELLRKWRLETPLDHFAGIRRRFNAAKVEIFAYNYSFNDSFSDAEIDRGFEIARALGAQVITASSTLAAAKRVVPFAEKHKMIVAMHNHSNIKNPNEFATPESFAAAMAMSKYFKINLDIGHFTAANFDPVAYIGQYHADITNLHLKDRRKNQGDNTPWGEGDTPIREVLRLLKETGWPIRAYVEYEYPGAGSAIDEVKTCLAYARKALE